MAHFDPDELPAANGKSAVKHFANDPAFLRFHGLPSVEPAEEKLKSHTWSLATKYELRMTSYVFEKALRARANDWDELTVKARSDFEFAHGEKAAILKGGVAVAIVDRRIVSFEVYEGTHAPSPFPKPPPRSPPCRRQSSVGR